MRPGLHKAVQASCVAKSISDDSSPLSRCWKAGVRVPPQYIDLWEHACFLFDNGDWESALHSFILLESWTTCSHVMTILLMNIGVILCHLGSHTRALVMLERAVELWPTLPVAQFILGVVKYELGHYASARIDFMIATLALETASISTLDHRPIALDFSLTINHLRDNEVSSAYATTLAHKAGRQTPILHRLPAGLIFKSPISPLIQAACSVTNTSADRSTDVEPEERTPKQAQVARIQPLFPKSITRSYPPETESENRTSMSFGRFRPNRNRSYSLGDTATCEAKVKSSHSHKHDSFRDRFSRRRSKVEESLLHIPEIILNATSSKSAHDAPPIPPLPKSIPTRSMMPREPRAEHVPLHELSSFIRHSGPEYLDKSRCRPQDAASKAETLNTPRKGSHPLETSSSMPALALPSVKSSTNDTRTGLRPKDIRPHSENISEFASFINSSIPRDSDEYERTDISPTTQDLLSKKSVEPRSARAPSQDVGDFVSFLRDGYSIFNTTTKDNRQRTGHPKFDDAGPEDHRFDSMYDEDADKLDDTASSLSRNSPGSIASRRASSTYSRPVDVSYPWEQNIKDRTIASDHFYAANNSSTPYITICKSQPELVEQVASPQLHPPYLNDEPAQTPGLHRSKARRRIGRHTKSKSTSKTADKTSAKASDSSLFSSARAKALNMLEGRG